MAPVRKLVANLPTQEGLTLRVGIEISVTDEFTAGWNNAPLHVIVVGEARYHVREEDLAYALGEP